MTKPETDWVLVKREPMRAILDWATKEGFAGLRDEIAAMLASVPLTETALVKEWEYLAHAAMVVASREELKELGDRMAAALTEQAKRIEGLEDEMHQQDALNWMKRCQAAEAEVERLTKDAAKEEASLLRTIDEREAAEEAVSQIYYLIIGQSAPWSNNFGFAHAIEEITDAFNLARETAARATTAEAALETARVALRGDFLSAFLDGRNEHGSHVLPLPQTSIPDDLTEELQDIAEQIICDAEAMGHAVGHMVVTRWRHIPRNEEEEGYYEYDGISAELTALFHGTPAEQHEALAALPLPALPKTKGEGT